MDISRRQRQHHRPGVLLLVLSVPFLAALRQFAWVQVPPPSESSASPSKPRSSRRRELAVGSIASGLLGLAGAPAPAAAGQIGWQLRLPRSWETLDQNDPPGPGSAQAVPLITAANRQLGSQVEVLRVPLDVAKSRSPEQAEDAKKILAYFNAPTSSKPPYSAAEAGSTVLKSFKNLPGLTDFKMDKEFNDRTQGKRRYIKYEYQAAICDGQLVFGANKTNLCQEQGGTTRNLVPIRHSVTLTASKEGTGAYSDILWIVDVSGPNEIWSEIQESVEQVSSTFVVGDEDELSEAREKDIKKQIEAGNALLEKELDKAGIKDPEQRKKMKEELGKKFEMVA